MSDSFMIVLPVDPLAVPPKERIEAAYKLLSELRPDAQEIELHALGTPEFYFAAENLESVFCPLCQADLGDWWPKAVTVWGQREDRRDLSIETPCCHRMTSVNDLDYDEPQGFGCVAFELMNPSFDLEPEELQQVETALGVPVRVIWKRI
jgi:hypothetical protein